jgi:hypothetical protein
MAKEKSDLKVSPGKKDEDVKSKARQMLLKHPEVMYNARNLFHNENGTTIIEERVPRGDAKKEDAIMPRTQGDLTDTDLRELAVFASSLVDETMNQYDQKVAHEDALQRAIGSKDGGKYAGKVNASTFALLLDNMGKSKKSKKASEEQPVPEQNTENSKEATMDKALIMQELEATRIKMAALEALAGGEVEAKEKPTCDKCGGKHWPFQKCSEKSEKKEDSSKEAKEMPTCGKCNKKHWPFQGCGDKKEEPKKDDKKDDKDASESVKSIVASLDEIAGALEAQKDFDLFKIAYQIDQVSDVLLGKKEAATLESDTDEKYMREFFKAGLREGDSDEKSFMGEFNTDTTTELNAKYPNGLGKDASVKLPYQVKK